MELEVRTFLDLPVSFWQVKNLLDACKEVRRASSFWHACTWGTCESKTKFQTFLGLVWFSHRRIVWCELSCHSRAHRDCTWLENPPCITAWWCYFTILKKYEFDNGKDDIPYVWWKIKAMFQTTNQNILHNQAFMIQEKSPAKITIKPPTRSSLIDDFRFKPPRRLRGSARIRPSLRQQRALRPNTSWTTLVLAASTDYTH